MGDKALRGNRLTFAKGGRAGFQKGRRVGHKRTGNTQRENRLEELGRVDSERAWTKHGKRDLRLEKHRIRDELKKGGKPWGTGPKPGSHEFMVQNLHKPRKGKAIGGVAKIAKTVKKFATEHHKKKKLAEDTKKGKFPETESLTHQVGPYVGDVGSEGKKAKKFAKRSHKKEEAAEAATGFAKGGKADKKESKPGKAYWKAKDKKEDIRFMELMHEKKGLKKHPQSTLVGRAAMEQKKLNKDIGQTYNPYNPKSEKNPGGYTGTHPRGSIDKRLGAKKGGKADKNWIQKAVNPKHKGFCTPMTKKTCTPRRKALARTFKKKAKTGW